MSNLYIDCEFNEFGGQLISMALVTGTGFEFYEVLDCPNPGPWVKDNVIPILGKEPISKEEFQDKDRKSTRLNSSHTDISRMPSSA